MVRRQPDERPRRGYRERRINIRSTIDRFLIVCEGERTEPNYFRAFRVTPDVFSVKVEGTGYNTLSLVNEAIRLRKKHGYTKRGDQVWCVFDRDSFPPHNFNEAIRRAEAEGMKVAYSNEAFELWYLLHFHYYDTAISRSQYCEKLGRLLNSTYLKNDPRIFEMLLSRQEQAIRHATRLLEVMQTTSPADDNPSTTVHRLVEELRKFMRW